MADAFPAKMIDASPAAASTARPMSDQEFFSLQQLIYRHSGIRLTEEKRDLLRARLGGRIRELKMANYREYYELVVNDPSGQELVRLIDAISTNLTYFFREPSHFELLRKEVLPALLADKNKRGQRRIRFWSAGCSSGEEPYSLLMIVLPLLKPASAWDFKLLASDISTKVLAAARAGVYGLEQVKRLNPVQIEQYFERLAEGLGVSVLIKSFITFARINLLEPFPFQGPFEVIFCRNVMIYFDRPTQQKVVNKFWDYLSPGGHLFIGHSENLTGLDHRFRFVRPAVYRK